MTISGETVTFHSATVSIVPFAGRELIVVTCLFARTQPVKTNAIAMITAGIVCVFMEKDIKI